MNEKAVEAAARDADKAFSEWAWLREGEPIGYMAAHVAARLAFKAGAEWAQRAALPLVGVKRPEDVARALNEKAIVRRLRENAAAARMGEVTPPASLFDDAANEIERLSALPPLRAREEIARLPAKLMQIADGALDDPADEAVVRDAADALVRLSRTAGQEWREPADNQTTDKLWKDSVGL